MTLFELEATVLRTLAAAVKAEVYVLAEEHSYL